MRADFSRLHLSERAIPWALLFITVISFGLLIPWLGFYWDDWPVIYMTRTQGTAGFWDFYQYDRPFSAWTYIVFAPLLGTAPFGWHIFTLLLRWLTAIFLWASLRSIWPEKPHQVFWAAVLFLVCPIFTQQPIAVAYSQHWICYLLYFGSVYFMLKAQENRRWFYPCTALAVLMSLLQMMTMEYFLGLELLRPFILWFYYREREPDASHWQLIKRVTGAVWIYGLGLLGYVIWRMFFLRLAGTDPNRPVFLDNLLDTPVQALLNLVQKAIQDFLYLMTAWLAALNPTTIDLQRPFSVVALAIAVLATVLFVLLMGRYQARDVKKNEDGWHRRAMFLGVLAILLGTLPVWLIDRQISVGALGNRFSLAAIFGVSLLLVGFLEWLSPRRNAKLIVVCVLAGIAIYGNLHNAKAFQQSWEKQRSFYWQLFWRAPYIPPNTAFISSGEIFPFVGLYSTSMGISLLYPPVEQPTEVPYWFFAYAERIYRFPDELIQGTVLEEDLRNYVFSGDSQNSIILDFAPEKKSCLQLASLRDNDDPDIPSYMKRLLSISNLERIERAAPNNWQPPASIFGQEPQHTWCYYFERADLAYQYQDWSEVIHLMDEAKAQGYSPAQMREYLPLLYAYLQTGDIENALSLSVQMSRLSNNIDDRVCGAWVELSESRSDAEFTSAFEKVRERSNCFD